VIASAPKSRRWLSLFVLIAVLILVAGIVFEARQKPSLSIRGRVFHAEVVRTTQQQRQGLSGRTQIDANYVMVFPANESQNRCFWMKDMRINIDIVWLDGSNKIAAIERDISPSTYPQNFCHEGKTVLEFKANVARDLGLQQGDQVQSTSVL